jgi:uncharacterized phage protein (TIGR01671 family)
MREIKFRVWNKENKYMADNEICFYYDNFKTFIEHPQFYEIMQYTGLKDMNRKEIYEGDIIKDTKVRFAYVIFLQQEMGYVLVYLKNDVRLLGHRNTGSGYDIDLNLEVIGNIYENPELWKDGAVSE